MKNAKRNIIVATVLLFVCAAVYLNWSYNNRRDDADDVLKEQPQQTASAGSEESDYFARARLTRQTSRDEALSLLETAAAGEGASQETIDSAMDAIAAMAAASMQETQIENLLLARDFADCVVYIASDGVTVAVPAPVEGLSSALVAQVTETVCAETGLSAEDIRVIEVKPGASDTEETIKPSASPAAPSASPAAE